MPTNILMPALSPTMEKGNLAKWLKKEGDTIKSGDILAEIETDKATMEVEAIDEGVLAKIVVPEGTADVPVNDIIAVIAGEGEDAGTVGKASVGKGDFSQPAVKPADEKSQAATEKQVEKARRSRKHKWQRAAAATKRSGAAATTNERTGPRLRLAASAAHGEGWRLGSVRDPRLRPAWPHRRARRQGGHRRRHGEEGAARRGAAAEDARLRRPACRTKQ